MTLVETDPPSPLWVQILLLPGMLIFAVFLWVACLVWLGMALAEHGYCRLLGRRSRWRIKRLKA